LKPITEGPFRRYLNDLNYNCLEYCLSGITNDSKDPSVDTFKSITLPILKRFGVPSDGLELKIASRGLPPNGGGEVVLSLPVVQSLAVSFWFFWWFRLLFKFVCYLMCTSPDRLLVGLMKVLWRKLEELPFQPECLFSLKIAWLKLPVE